MHSDPHLKQAQDQIERVLRGNAGAPVVQAFFDEATFTASYVVYDPHTRRAAIVDSVLDFDQPSGRTSTASADEIIAFVQEKGLTVVMDRCLKVEHARFHGGLHLLGFDTGQITSRKALR